MDEERTVAWIDYIIASDEAADQALATEFLANSWAHGETMRWMLRELQSGKLSPEMMARMEQEQEEAHALQKRICSRAQELAASGARPADETTANAWHERRLNLSTTIPSEHDPVYRT